MRRSTGRIITSHVGALPRPAGLPGRGARSYDVAPDVVSAAVSGIVDAQLRHGVDVVGDGEFGKSNFVYYVRHRFSGLAERALNPGEEHPNDSSGRRDLTDYPGYFQARGGLYPLNNPVLYCADEFRFVGQDSIKADTANLRAAMARKGAEDGFLTAVSPCTVALIVPNGHYAKAADYHLALANALHDEYRAVTDAGLTLQIDEPGLAGLWQTDRSWTIAQFRRACEVWIELLNYALRDCPPSQVRLHCCWGSYKGPHTGDVELASFVDLLFKVRADCFSIEGANPRHEHEWQVFEDFRLPEGRMLMPGVVTHAADTVEHPELVAQRLVRYADLVGRENVIAGTDCGMSRVHAEVCWAKLAALAAGAEIASKKLWA